MKSKTSPRLQIKDVKNKKHKERPWRLVSKEFTGNYEVRTAGPHGHCEFEVFGLYRHSYRQYYGSNGAYSTRQELIRSPCLGDILARLSLSDKEGGLIDLMQGGFSILEKLFQRYDWQQRQKQEAELVKRRIAWATKKKVWDERKAHNTRMKRVQDKQFGRRLEV